MSAVPSIDVLIQRLSPDVPLPVHAHPGDAGLDLVSTRDATIEPGQRVLVPTGIAVALPPGWYAAIVPRSGLAVRSGLGIVNSPGTVDAGYRGEIQVCLINLDPQHVVTVSRGDRIAQMVLQQVPHVRLHEVEQLPGSARGADGFGSTGVASAKGDS